MTRRVDPDVALREGRRQRRMMDALDAKYERRWRAEIARAMADMVTDAEEGRDIQPPTDHYDRLMSILRDQATDAIRVFGARVLILGLKAGGTAPERKDWLDRFLQVARWYLGQEAIRRRITSIADTTRNSIIEALQRGLEEGLGINSIGRLIRERIPTVSTYRANLIARTETHGAANYGASVAVRETGLQLRKFWIAAEDERTRLSHAIAGRYYTENPIPEGENFIVGGAEMAFPGDPNGPPGQVINCRCAVGHIVVD